MKPKIINFMLSKCLFALLLIATLTPCAIAQTRLTYANTAGAIFDWPTDLDWAGPFVVYGYGERFDLPVNPGTIDSVDFVMDGIASDSIVLELLKDTLVNYDGAYELVPSLTSVPYAKTTIYNEEIIPGSRTHVSIARTVVPDSFFVVLINDSNIINEYRSYRVSPENVQLSHSVFLAVDTEYGSGDFTASLDKSFATNIGDTLLYSEMDFGVTYEGTDGVQEHISSSPASAKVWPNPAPRGNQIRLSGADSVISAEVVDEAGRIIRNYQVGNNNSLTEIPTQGLSSGVYNVVLFHSDGSTSSVKFVVE
jgi:hypothetical protein